MIVTQLVELKLINPLFSSHASAGVGYRSQDECEYHAHGDNDGVVGNFSRLAKIWDAVSVFQTTRLLS